MYVGTRGLPSARAWLHHPLIHKLHKGGRCATKSRSATGEPYHHVGGSSRTLTAGDRLGDRTIVKVLERLSRWMASIRISKCTNHAEISTQTSEVLVASNTLGHRAEQLSRNCVALFPTRLRVKVLGAGGIHRCSVIGHASWRVNFDERWVTAVARSPAAWLSEHCLCGTCVS